MRGNRNILRAKLALIAAAVPVLIYAYEYGPDPGYAGVPGESTCTACHGGTANSGPGSVSVAFPNGLTYTPGATQRVVVTVADPDQRRWGFQLTARLAGDTTKPAGSFTAGADGYTQVLCSTQPYMTQVPAPCPENAPMAFVEQTAKAYQESVARFEFDWTPPASDVGPVAFYVAGNAANGDLRTTGDRIYTANYTLAPAAGGGGGGARPTISERGVVNGASFQPVISAGSWISIMGSNLAAGTRVSNGLELPAEMDGVSVSVNGKPARLYYISPTQINAVAPQDEALGDVAVTVTNAGGTSDAVMVRMERYSPAFFLWKEKYAVAMRPDLSWVGKTDLFAGLTTSPAKPGQAVILWGTGFGPLDTPPVIRMGDVTAEYLAGGPAPGSPGMYLIAIKVPDAVPDGDVPVTAESGGIRSPDNVFITVQR